MRNNYTFKHWRKLAAVTVVALAASNGVCAQITSFPWTETFEDNSTTRAAWTQIHEVNNMNWTFATSPSTGSHVGNGNTVYQGSKMANFPGTSHQFDKTKLVSPAMDLSGMSSANLEFYYRNPFWSPDQNWLRIFYRTSATADWVQIGDTFHENIPNWTSSGIIALPNLSATYQIAIECETDYGYSTTVDALTVSGTPLSAADFNKLTVQYYPNPAQNQLNISANEPIARVEIYSLLGQKVYETKQDSNQVQLNISELQPGNYIVHALGETGTQTFKLSKK